MNLDLFLILGATKQGLRGCLGLLHKLHHGAASQKTGVCGIPL
jgi:hypothetical protein